MTEDQHQVLSGRYPNCVPCVLHLRSRGVDLDRAWLLAGALVGYTGNSSIPSLILKYAGRDSSDSGSSSDEEGSTTGRRARSGGPYPKAVGQINDYLRNKNASGTRQEFENLLELLALIEDLPDWDSRGRDPTRMMDHYGDIDRDYALGNILIMQEVGSVSRHRPTPAYYRRRYRLHFTGGLKDVTAFNAQQQEVIYAPGAAYKVVSRHTGKIKTKKGGHAHEHIYLRYVSKESEEFRNARASGRVYDLGDETRHERK